MIIQISKNNKILGTIDFDKLPVVLGGVDLDLSKLLEDVLEKGVPFMKEKEQGQERVLYLDNILKDDLIFPLALRDYLKMVGYTVIEKHPQIEADILSLLEDVPDSNEDKKDILNRLKSMSHLEQTALLEELKGG